jgi:hypothetical protein
MLLLDFFASTIPTIHTIGANGANRLFSRHLEFERVWKGGEAMDEKDSQPMPSGLSMGFKRARSGAISGLPFCRQDAVLGIEKRVFLGLREYTKVNRIIQGIF